MFFDVLEALGTFFGGLGAFIAATVQLVGVFRRKRDGAETAQREELPNSGRIPSGPVFRLAA